MIELCDITVRLPREGPDATTILDGIDLRIREGEWLTIAGPNGCGKTTLLKTIAGLIPVAAGELRVSADSRESGVALLLQEPDNQFVSSSARWELVLSLPPDMPDGERTRRLESAIDKFELGGLLDRNPHRLSGGEKQRLAFATVWLSDPTLLLLDEPTSYLDRVQSKRCHGFVRELNDAGVTVVWAAPDADGPASGGRVIYLDHGRLVDARVAATSGDAMAGARLSGSATERVHASDTSAAAQVTETVVGGDVAAAEVIRSDRPPVIRMRSVSFAYESSVVLNDLSLEIQEGECVAITGLNGTGKSTLLNILSGVLEPTVGAIDRRYSHVVEGNRQNVFYLFQSPETLFFTETAYDEIAYGLDAIKTRRRDIERRVDEALARVGLAPDAFRERAPHSLSFGEMRRLAFAITIALDPQFLLMDEPASCLDAAGRALLEGLLHDFKARGRTVVVAAHDTSAFASAIDRVIELGV